MEMDRAYVSNLNIDEGNPLGKCHIVTNFLGEGSFGYVCECLNTKTGKTEAIKVNKSHPDAIHKAKMEIAILKQLRCLDPDTCNIVKWNGFFFQKEHICLNFELLDQNLAAYMEDRNYHGLPMTDLKAIIQQMANALSHLRATGIIHADLKPENVMVVDRRQEHLNVKLIDFDMAHPVFAAHPDLCVQGLCYRAPEVMLGIPYNEAIDMWSLGLIAAELATGYPLYPGNTDYDMLSFIIETQGQPPDYLLDRGVRTQSYFYDESNGQQRWRFKTAEEFESETGHNHVETRYMELKCLDDLQQLMDTDQEHQRDQHLLVDLIKRMLQLDPDQRIKPLEVLQHPFIAHNFPQDHHNCIEMIHADEGRTAVIQQSSWYERDASESIQCNDEDTTGHINGGILLGKCHEMMDFLGEGGFGEVSRCYNIETGKMEAIKVNKSSPEIVHQAKLEIAMLKRLRCLDPDTCNIVRWNGFFFHKENICLNFELLDQSLRDYMGDRDYQHLSMVELRPIIHQLATALSHLRSIGIIHADVKPDNVMVLDRQQNPLSVKLIDFGLAHPALAARPGVCVQTIWYRAPEIILQTPYNEGIDMWSLGLTVAELATGYPIYPGSMDYDVLHFIVQTQGQPPDYLLDRGMGSQYYFKQESNGQQRWSFKTPEEFESETGLKPQETRWINPQCLDDLEQLIAVDEEHPRDRRLLVDLINRMLHLDPDLRISPLEVLQHPFMTQSLPQSTHPDTSIEIVNDDKERAEIIQESSSDQTAGTENIHCRDQSTTVSLAAELKENTGDIQPETSPQNDGYFRPLIRKIKDTFLSFFTRNG